MKKVAIFLSLGIFLIVSCTKEKEMAQEAEAYLNEVLNIMEKNSINRSKIDWVNFRNEVINTVPTAQTIDDTYPGIKKALKLLGDNHSAFVTPNGNFIMGNSYIIEMENIGGPAIPNYIGYVTVTSNTPLSFDASSIAYANQIQNQIKHQDHSDLKGWIVDLRNNTGGNLWPMLAGIGPILGEGVAGYFSYPDGIEVSWGFQGQASVMNGIYVGTQLSDSYNLLVPKPKVAVLLNSAVASSGEAVAISFIGRENTKSFGSATRGLSTSNQPYQLSNKAILNLTTAYFADRNKKIYGVPINPDVISSKETIISDAVSWIRE